MSLLETVLRAVFVPIEPKDSFISHASKRTLDGIIKDPTYAQYVTDTELPRTKEVVNEYVTEAYDSPNIKLLRWMAGSVDTYDKITGAVGLASAPTRFGQGLMNKILRPIEIASKVAFSGSYWILSPESTRQKITTIASFAVIETPELLARKSRILGFIGDGLDLLTNVYVNSVESSVRYMALERFKQNPRPGPEPLGGLAPAPA